MIIRKSSALTSLADTENPTYPIAWVVFEEMEDIKKCSAILEFLFFPSQIIDSASASVHQLTAAGIDDGVKSVSSEK